MDGRAAARAERRRARPPARPGSSRTPRRRARPARSAAWPAAAARRRRRSASGTARAAAGRTMPPVYQSELAGPGRAKRCTDWSVGADAAWLGRLGPVGDDHHLVLAQPGHALHGAVADPAPLVAREEVRRPGVEQLPARRGQAPDPEGRRLLRHDRHPVAGDADAAVVGEPQARREVDRRDALPLRGGPRRTRAGGRRPGAGPALPPRPRLPSQSPSRYGAAGPTDAGQALEALVGPLQRDVEPSRRQRPQVAVELVDLGHEPGPAPHRLDQKEEPPVGRVVGDVLVADRAVRLPDQRRPRVARAQPRVDPGDVRQVVEDHPVPAVVGEHTAGLVPAAAVSDQVGDLGLRQQPQRGGEPVVAPPPPPCACSSPPRHAARALRGTSRRSTRSDPPGAAVASCVRALS